jgi:hypothetical protein
VLRKALQSFDATAFNRRPHFNRRAIIAACSLALAAKPASIREIDDSLRGREVDPRERAPGNDCCEYDTGRVGRDLDRVKAVGVNKR